VTPKNRIYGRTLLSNAELRQRTTVVVEFDATKAGEQLEKTGVLAAHSGYGSLFGHIAPNWDKVKVPHDVLVVYVAHNAKDGGTIIAAINDKERQDQTKYPGLYALRLNRAPIYTGVTFEGAPDNGGKLPFVYVMGYEGKEPVMKEAFGAKTAANVAAAIAAQKKKLSAAGLAWKPYYGYVAEPKHFKDIGAAMEKGKPLDAVEAKLKKGVAARDPEVAKEAQMLYDALEQTRSDMTFIVTSSWAACPYVAAYTMGQIFKCWPRSKKSLSDVAEKIKANAAAQPLVKMYPKLKTWADPEFTCKNDAEAKKIVAELQKMKKSLAPLKEDKNMTVQNGACSVDVIVDGLIETIPCKVATK